MRDSGWLELYRSQSRADTEGSKGLTELSRHDCELRKCIVFKALEAIDPMVHWTVLLQLRALTVASQDEGKHRVFVL